eukprot:16447481-Heterocapsa_arctica.AAC.1
MDPPAQPDMSQARVPGLAGQAVGDAQSPSPERPSLDQQAWIAEYFGWAATLPPVDTAPLAPDAVDDRPYLNDEAGRASFSRDPNHEAGRAALRRDADRTPRTGTGSTTLA